MTYLQTSDRVRLIKQMGKLGEVGKSYEIGFITEKAYIIRDINSKIAVSCVSIDDFDEYFVKEDNEIRRWSRWNGLSDTQSNLIAYYRTNGKKTQVKNVKETLRAESSCNIMDNFDLRTGISIALLRLNIKEAKTVIKDAENAKEEFEDAIKFYQDSIASFIKNVDQKSNYNKNKS